MTMEIAKCMVSILTLKHCKSLLMLMTSLKKNKPWNVNDNLSKIWTFLELVRNSCVKVEPEQNHNISVKINWSGWVRGVEDSALGLRQKVPCNRNFKVLFDNWFLTLPLSVQSQSMETFATATLWSNHLTGCHLMSEKDFKKETLDSFDYGRDLNSSLLVSKGFKNE